MVYKSNNTDYVEGCYMFHMPNIYGTYKSISPFLNGSYVYFKLINLSNEICEEKRFEVTTIPICAQVIIPDYKVSFYTTPRSITSNGNNDEFFSTILKDIQIFLHTNKCIITFENKYAYGHYGIEHVMMTTEEETLCNSIPVLDYQEIESFLFPDNTTEQNTREERNFDSYLFDEIRKDVFESRENIYKGCKITLIERKNGDLRSFTAVCLDKKVNITSSEYDKRKIYSALYEIQNKLGLDKPLNIRH